MIRRFTPVGCLISLYKAAFLKLFRVLLAEVPYELELELEFFVVAIVCFYYGLVTMSIRKLNVLG